jgi:hypothetical protein
VFLGAPHEDNDSGTSFLSSMVAERKSGDEYVSYIVPNDEATDILSTI